MQEQIEKSINRIFEGYEDTPELQDFKAEIAANLSERIQDIAAKGIPEQIALEKALEELGDISEAADTISRKKRQEIIGQTYLRQVPLDKIHAVGYPLAGVVFIFGIIVSAITGFSSGMLRPIIATLMPFTVAAVGAFVYLGLTQETRTRYPLSWKRALLYSLSSMLLIFGIFACFITLFVEIPVNALNFKDISQLKLQLIALNPVASLGTLIPFILPALAILAFLILTEKERKKPWVLRSEEEYLRSIFSGVEGIYDEKFGLLSGALWILALGLFIVLGIYVGWSISWITFIFALAAQLILQYFTLKNKPAKDK